MFIIEGWVNGTNDLIEYLDEELLRIRKIAYETAIALNQECQNLEKNKKEEARLREKSRLLELREEIEILRKQIAKIAYQSRIRTATVIFEAIIFVFSLFSKMPFSTILCALILLAGIISLIANYVCLKRSSTLMVQACSQYGVIEANIKTFDYRELETIDLDRLPFRTIKYDRRELAGPL